MARVYRNQDERLGTPVLFTLAEMRECYRANGWDNGMDDDQIDADVLSHDVEFVGNWTDEEIAAAGDDLNPEDRPAEPARELKAGGYTFTRDGRAEWIGDAQHRGTEVFWSEHRGRWVLVDLENEEVQIVERIAAVRCNGDADEGLNQHAIACDLDGAGLWIVDAEYLDDCDEGYLDVIATA